MNYCQSCHARNRLIDKKCRRCGTPLPPIVYLFSENDHFLADENFLLDQISLLELKIETLSQQIAKLTEAVLRQNEIAHRSSTNQTSAENHLTPDLTASSLEIHSISHSDKKQNAKNKEQAELIEKILSANKKPNLRSFPKLVQDGILLIANGETEKGLRILEKAFFMSSDNEPLACFLAKKLFEADEFERTKKILEKLTETMRSSKASLVLSAIYTDEGDVQKAVKHLRLLKQETSLKTCVCYIWTFLLALENQWKKALRFGRELLKINQAPEVYYLIGCLYFQLSDYKKAKNFFQNAVQLDERFSDAWFMMGLTLLACDDAKSANEALSKAWSTKEAGSKCLQFLKQPLPSIALPFLQPRRPLTANSRRLSKFFSEEIQKAL